MRYLSSQKILRSSQVRYSRQESHFVRGRWGKRSSFFRRNKNNKKMKEELTHSYCGMLTLFCKRFLMTEDEFLKEAGFEKKRVRAALAADVEN